MPTRRTVLAGLTAGLAGCGLSQPEDGIDPSPPPGTESAWYTHPQPTGNRTLSGTGDIRTVEPVQFEPAGDPQWLVARPAEAGSYWTVATGDGRVTDWLVADGSATRERDLGQHPVDSPPVIRRGSADASLLDPPESMGRRGTPVVTTRSDDRPSKLLYVAGNGDLVIVGSETTRLSVDAPPDSRLAAVGDGRYALFGDATDRYRHGALGDSIEGETLYVVDADSAEITAQTTLDVPAVFEGLQPLVADLDDDGEPEIVTTVADSSDGARIAVFAPSGERRATGPIYGPGWRHQLTVASFGPDGRPELAVVRKPHVDRVVEFYRLADGELDVVGTAGGFSSHTYGSRILGGGIAGPFGGDGTTALLVPTTERDELAVVRREGGGTTVGWRHSLESPVTSNITGVTRRGGGLAVGVATASTVSVWQS